MIYDYIIKMPMAPAFSANIEAMFSLVVADGGHSPSLIDNRDANGDHTTYSYLSQKGTIDSLGAHLFHFRLRSRKTSTELVTYLESVMSDPKPPISVIFIKSRDPINVGTEQSPDFQFEELVSINKSDILEFFEIHTFDAQGNIISTRVAELTDTLSFSRYGGVPTVEV